MIISNLVKKFFSSKAYGVAGASNDPQKFGNRIVVAYLDHGMAVYPINPKESLIEGQAVFKSVLDLPAEVASLSIVTPPAVTEMIVSQAISHGIKNIWIQPGAQSEVAIKLCQNAGINLIADGTCVLVELKKLNFK